VKLVHLVGFITKKFVPMHGHMNVKFVRAIVTWHANVVSALRKPRYFPF